METKKEPAKLQDEVAKNYDLVGVQPGVHNFPNFGTIDLTKISAADAENLVNSGFPYLKKKEEANPKG